MHPIGSVSWKALINTPRMLMSYNVNGTPTEKHCLNWVEILILWQAGDKDRCLLMFLKSSPFRKLPQRFSICVTESYKVT